MPLQSDKSSTDVFGTILDLRLTIRPRINRSKPLMKFSKAVVLMVLCQFVSLVVSAAEPVDELKQATAAKKILDAYHASDPQPHQRHLHIVCWTPADREFPENYRQRLTRIMTHIQGFYKIEMERLGFADSTIGLQFDESDLEDSDLLVVHEVRGQHPDEHYERQSGREIRSECEPVLKAAGVDPASETVLIMCNLATWDAEQLRFTHKSPYYASGSYQRGTAWQLDSPELDALNLKLTKPLIQDGEYGRISLGKHNSIFIGGIAHELGHALGLPHCMERPDEAYRGTALMGSGNRTYGDEVRGEGKGSFITFAHALRLASHPQFSGSVKGMDVKPSLDVSEFSISADKQSIHVSGKVVGEPPVYAVVAYFDPEGRGDYDAKTATAVPDENGQFSLSCDALTPGRKGELRVFPLHANGSAGMQMSRTKFRYPYSVNADGTPDVSSIEIRQELEPFVSSLASNRREIAQELSSKLKHPTSVAIAARLLKPGLQGISPGQLNLNVKRSKLTDFSPSSAKVGWARPTYDRIPDRSMLVEANGQLFVTGIYAHAPATHVYELDHRWKRFTGKVGLADGHPGSVQFEIQGDGKSLWKSKTIGPGTIERFDVSVESMSQLNLITETTADGAAADWGLWLDPEIHR